MSRMIDADLLGLTDMEIIMCDGDYKEALKMLLDKIENAPTIEPQLEIAEKLSMYKCYVTDENGLQHEVIHTGDIRRVTGWMI